MPPRLRHQLLALLDRTRLLDRLVPLLSPLLRLYTRGERRGEYFHRWEQAGIHVTPVHFYQPIPDTRNLPDTLWTRPSDMVGVDIREAAQLELLTQVFPQYQAEYSHLPHDPTGQPHVYYLFNTMFGWADALVLYCLIRHYKPTTILEVGGGMSTRLSAQAAQLNGATEVISIEPYPDDTLVAGFPGLTRLIREPVQNVSLDVFQALTANDILFIDSSHVVKCGSDVNYLFLEVLPRLQPGVLVHVHDIFLPDEFPQAWIKDMLLFWNEQYLLHAFLLFNSEFEIVFANSLMGRKYPAEMAAAFGQYGPGGGSLWLRRKLPTTP